MEPITRNFTFLTAAFPHGAYQSQGFNQPELRPPSVKGQLRWWYDALFDNKDTEDKLFGGLKNRRDGDQPGPESSRVIVRIRCLTPHQSLPVDFIPHKGNGVRKNCVPPGTQYEIHLIPRREGASEAEQTRLERVLDAWLLLGAVGQRGNRAAGSLWPENAPQTPDEFLKRSVELLGNSRIKAAILDRDFGNDERQLRHVAGNFLAGEAFHSCNTPFGEVDSRNRIRKPSLLKLRAARLDGGLRLVALWDGRWPKQPVSNLRRGIEIMAQETDKPIGKLLLAAMHALTG